MKLAQTCLVLFVIATSSTAFQGCGSKSSTGATLNVAAITPIVKASLPAGLQPGGSATVAAFEPRPHDRSFAAPTPVPTYTPTINTLPSSLPADNSDQYVLAQAYIANLFQATFVGMSDGNSVTGYLVDLVEQADGRMGILNGQSTSGHTCLSSTPTAFSFDLSDISPVLTLSLTNLQCSSAFTSGSVATMAAGAGEVFGISADGTSASEWTSMLLTTGGTITDFINLAQITNLGSTSTSAPESVDGLVIQYSAASPASINATRYRANATLKTFEMYYANTGSYLQGVQGGAYTSVLGAGFRMVSDGTYIYADGYLANPPGDATPSSPNSLIGNVWVPFAVCLNGSNLTVDPNMADCATAYGDFTLAQTAALNTDQLAGVTTPINTVIMAGPGVTGVQTPGAAVVTEVSAKAQITTAPANVTAF